MTYDVVVIGGGAAGLNGALMLARSRRSTLVVDGGEPRNAPAGQVHGLLARDGTPPAELLAQGRKEVLGYGGEIADSTVESATRDGDDLFAVTLTGGQTVHARRLLVATGLADELPDIPGLRGRWGRDVLHCPYCHGWEVRDRAVGILAAGPRSAHIAQLFRQLTADVTYLSHTTEALPDEESEQLAARGIRVASGTVASVETTGDRLTGARLADGTLIPLDALVVTPRMNARAGFLRTLGLSAVEHPAGAGDHVPADATGRTAVAGVWAAGNVTDPFAQVGAAAAAGALAGAHINADLVAEETATAVTARRRNHP